MLAAAAAVALGPLIRLSPQLPFGAVVVARSLVECAADLH
jgi:hypothetical protein